MPASLIEPQNPLPDLFEPRPARAISPLAQQALWPIVVLATTPQGQTISVQDIDTIFACIVGFSESVNSNMLSKFLTEPRELLRQPNLDRNKAKYTNTNFSSAQEIEEFVV